MLGASATLPITRGTRDLGLCSESRHLCLPAPRGPTWELTSLPNYIIHDIKGLGLYWGSWRLGQGSQPPPLTTKIRRKWKLYNFDHLARPFVNITFSFQLFKHLLILILHNYFWPRPRGSYMLLIRPFLLIITETFWQALQQKLLQSPS